MTKKINKPTSAKPIRSEQPRSFDIGIAKQKIKEILTTNGLDPNSIQPRLLSNFIDRIIESLKSNKPINKDALEQFFRKEVLQNQRGIDKSKINFGKISSEVNQLKNNLPTTATQSLALGSTPTALSTSLTSGGLQESLATQGRLEVHESPQRTESVIEKLLAWMEEPPAPSEIYTSPGIAEIRSGGNLSTIQLPKRTNPEAELSELIRQMPREELRERLGEITNTLTWYTGSFIPAQSGLSQRFFNGEQIKGHEVIEALDETLRTIAPDFNIKELINSDKTITRSDLANIGTAVNLKILMPRGVFAGSVDNGQLGIGFTLRDPEILITPKGNKMPMYVVYPFVGDFSYAYSDHEMLIYPYHRDASFAEGLKTVDKNWVNYKLGSSKEISFVTKPNAVVSWTFVQLMEDSPDIIKAQRIDTINEELSHHDLHLAFKEKEGVSFDTCDVQRKVEGVKKLLKPDSILLKELESIPQRESNPQVAFEKQDEFCNAINEIYAKLVSLERSPFPLLTLQDCIANSISDHGNLQNEPGEYAHARKFLAQFIWKELNNTPELQNASQEQWCTYFDTAIKGTDEKSDKEAIRNFNGKLIELAPKIVAEHFII